MANSGEDVIQFGPDVCTDPARATQLEWLETNGLGGFASSTIIGLNTRRYHGLLMAAVNGPARRVLLLSKFEETLVAGAHRYDLSSNRYPGVLHPQGYRYLREFRLDPFPVFTYEAGGMVIEKRVFMVYGENTTVVEYQLLQGASGPETSCTIEIRPLIAFREYHGSTHSNAALNPAIQASEGLAVVTPYADLPSLYLAHTGGALSAGAGWYYNFEFDAERERGLDFHEDLFNPLALQFTLAPGKPVALIASTGRLQAETSAELRSREICRRKNITAAAPSPLPLVRQLAAAADHFIVQRGSLKTIIAGYHWFTDWGRDTMIALPGLTLVTGRFEVAREILLAFAKTIDCGMLPNRFLENGEGAVEYNTVDASLWFFEAARAYLEYTKDYGFIRESIYPRLKEMIDWHVRGTRYHIVVDGDGLLSSGEPGVQLTWMDAKVGDWIVTPRRGKAVEIQALWYNALRITQRLAGQFGDPGFQARAGGMADRAQAAFQRLFWNDRAGCLYDVVNGGDCDGSIRPNQIFAVSLHHAILDDPDQAMRVVDVVDRELRTPLGLRSLAPGDPQYRPRSEGNARSRDAAYHQGTVWLWLLGPFISAYVAVHRHSEPARARAASWLEEFSRHLHTAGLGHLSENTDAEAPYTPRGCIAQAWSVAELLRCAMEDVYSERTPTARRAGIAPHFRGSGLSGARDWSVNDCRPSS